jgi:hypothetical protein
MKSLPLSSVLNRTLAIFLLGLTLILTPGCFVAAVGVAAGAGAGTVAWIKGELDADLGHGYAAVGDAANAAIGQLQFAKISESKDAFTDEIIARTAEDTKVSIKLTKQADTLTRVEIRVGTFGDEKLSRAILDRIKADL